ncbi:MAG: RNA polymerase sigma factor [Lysobacteraceae bacterium]
MGSAFAIELPPGTLDAARRGEDAAWALIYRCFEGPMFTLALRMTGCRDEAGDVLHDALLRAFERIGDFRGDAPFWGWLRQIAVNTALMRLRRKGRLDFQAEPPEPESTPEDPWLPPAAADAARLHEALAQLPDLTRSVLWLFHAEGYTHEEIGALMDQSPSFSKSRVARGTRQLRELLGSHREEVRHA